MDFMSSFTVEEGNVTDRYKKFPLYKGYFQHDLTLSNICFTVYRW